MKNVYVIVKTVINNENGKIEEVNVDACFETLSSAKTFLRNMAEISEEHKIDASEEILTWKATISTYKREIHRANLF